MVLLLQDGPAGHSRDRRETVHQKYCCNRSCGFWKWGRNGNTEKCMGYWYWLYVTLEPNSHKQYMRLGHQERGILGTARTCTNYNNVTIVCIIWARNSSLVSNKQMFQRRRFIYYIIFFCFAKGGGTSNDTTKIGRKWEVKVFSNLLATALGGNSWGYGHLNPTTPSASLAQYSSWSA